MARDEFVVFFAVGKQRFARYDLVAHLYALDLADDRSDILRVHAFGIERRADGHETGRVVGKHGVLVVEMQRGLKGFSEPLDKVERAA